MSYLVNGPNFGPRMSYLVDVLCAFAIGFLVLCSGDTLDVIFSYEHFVRFINILLLIGLLPVLAVLAFSVSLVLAMVQYRQNGYRANAVPVVQKRHLHLLGDEAAQAFIDSNLWPFGMHMPCLDLTHFTLLTRVPLRIPEHVRSVSFTNCIALQSVAGLPLGINNVSFIGCTSLTSVSGLPPKVQIADFTSCDSLKSVIGLPSTVKDLDISLCKSLVTLKGLPAGLEHVDFRGCRRLHRFPTLPKGCKFKMCSPNPADQARTCMRSGVGDQLLRCMGPDVALLIGCFATAGFNSSAQFNDRIEMKEQVLARYSRR